MISLICGIKRKEKVDLIEKDTRMVVTRGWGKGNGMKKIQWYKLQEVLRIWHTAQWFSLLPLSSRPVTYAVATKTPSVDSEKLKRQHSKTRNVWSIYQTTFARKEGRGETRKGGLSIYFQACRGHLHELLCPSLEEAASNKPCGNHSLASQGPRHPLGLIHCVINAALNCH